LNTSMFAACPHCHFLIALHPQRRVLPATCPRCGKQLDDGSPATAETAAVETGEEMPIGSPTVQTAAGVDTEPMADAALHQPDTEGSDVSAGADAAVNQEETSSDRQETDSDAHGTGSVAGSAATGTNAVATTHIAQAKKAIPSFTHTTRTDGVRTRVPKWQWAALTVLALALAIQTLLADRARLATDADWRPFVARLCGVFRCSIPVWHQPEAFTMLSRDVRPVDGSPGTLQAQATFRNDARWAQAWPIVLLTLKDADGRTLGARALTPAEYLDADQVQREIAPGQSAQIAVRIREPSANVVAFSFDFR
jgi:hypothetical protein